MKVYKTKDGAWQLNYTMDGRQRQIYLGVKHDSASASRVRDIVRDLLLCRYRCETPPIKLIESLRTLDVKLQATIKRHGILESRYTDVTLGEMIGIFKESKKSLKETSIKAYEERLKRVLWFFDPDVVVSEITPEDIKEFKAYLLTERKLSPCTVTGNIGELRSLFRQVLKRRFIYENPCDDIVAGPVSNGNRYRFIARETIEKALRYCKCDEERFGLMLSRYAGLRIPSEISQMKYGDFRGESFFVHESGKTGRREVPFFRELREMFGRLRKDKNENEHVFSRSVTRKGGLHERVTAALEKGGIERWPRLFNNLRASCVTEYDEMGFNEKTLDSIFGNTEKIRKRHYVGFRKDRAFMRLLGMKIQVVNELVGMGGISVENEDIDTEKIDIMIQYLVSLKTSRTSSGAVKTSVEKIEG